MRALYWLMLAGPRPGGCGGEYRDLAGDDTGSEADTGSASDDDDMSGSFRIRTTGSWDWGGSEVTFCDREYTFSGHAYIGACESCTFEFMIDTIESETTSESEHCTMEESIQGFSSSAEYASIIHTDLLSFTYTGSAPYPTTLNYFNAVAVRRWVDGSGYQYEVLAHDSPPDSGEVVVEDGSVSWTGTETTREHYYWDPGYGPYDFERYFSLDMSYVLPDAEYLEEEGYYTGGG